MITNLLATTQNPVDSADLTAAFATIFTAFGSILIIICILMILRAIFTFFIPFYIRSMKKSQKFLVEIEEERLKTENERLKCERQRLQLETERLAIYRERSNNKN